MDIAGGINPDKFFVTSLQQQAQLEALSNNALSAGIDKYMKKDYEGAALEFKKSIKDSIKHGLIVQIL